MDQRLNLAVYRIADLGEDDRIVAYNIIVVGLPVERDIHELLIKFLITDGHGTRYRPDERQVFALFTRWVQGRRFKHYPGMSGPRIVSFD